MTTLKFLIITSLLLLTSFARAGEREALRASHFANRFAMFQAEEDFAKLLPTHPAYSSVMKEYGNGKFHGFKAPRISMRDAETVLFTFEHGIVTVGFRNILKNELLVLGHTVRLERYKTYYNYRMELETIFRDEAKTVGLFSIFVPRAEAEVGELTRLAWTYLSHGFSVPVVEVSAESRPMIAYGDVLNGGAVTYSKDLTGDIIGFFQHEKFLCTTYDARECGKVQHAFTCADGRLARIGEWDPKTRAYTTHAWHLETANGGYVLSCEDDRILSATADFQVKKVLGEPSGEGRCTMDPPHESNPMSKYGALYSIPEAFSACCRKSGCYERVRSAVAQLYSRESAAGSRRSTTVQ